MAGGVCRGIAPLCLELGVGDIADENSDFSIEGLSVMAPNEN